MGGRIMEMETHCRIEHCIPSNRGRRTTWAYAVWKVDTSKHGEMEFETLDDAVRWINDNYFTDEFSALSDGSDTN